MGPETPYVTVLTETLYLMSIYNNFIIHSIGACVVVQHDSIPAIQYIVFIILTESSDDDEIVSYLWQKKESTTDDNNPPKPSEKVAA